MLQPEEDTPDTTHGSLIDAYRSKLEGGWVEDTAQERAVVLMSHLLSEVSSAGARVPKGLYLHGPVGRGKSQLLTLFMAQAGPGLARRTHMHAFMGEVHQRLHAIKSGDPIRQIARQLADECKLFGFDEFYVTNIADGILLTRLFEHLFRNGVVVVSTSNWPMDQLFLHGRNRKSFMPFIRLLKQHMNEVDLEDGVDYRQPDSPLWPLYVLTSSTASATCKLEALFDAARRDDRPEPEGFEAIASAGGIGWYSFGELCRQSVGRTEYLQLIRSLDTLIVQDVPTFGSDDSDAALRFITLIDICYDHHRRVIISAADYPDQLYLEGPIRDAFRRAASRLAEMQSWA